MSLGRYHHLLILFAGLICIGLRADPSDLRFKAGFIPERGEIMLGEPLYVTFYVENTGSNAFYIETGGDYRRGVRSSRFRFKATDTDGTLAPDPHPANSTMGGILNLPTVQPGESYSEKLYLPLWIRFEHPGQYVVHGERLIQLLARPGFSRAFALTNAFKTDFHLTVSPMDRVRLGQRIEQLGASLTSTNPADAARELADIEDERVVPFLLRVVNENNRAALAPSVEGLGKHPGVEVIRALIKALHNLGDSWVRYQAAVALGNMKSSDAEDALLDALDTGDSSIRNQAGRSLGNFGGERVIAALKSHLSEPDITTRFTYVETLCARGVPFHADWVESIIESKRLNEFQNAIWFVRRNAGSNAPAILAGCLDGKNPSVTNYYNYTLTWQIGACGGPKYTYHHDFDHEGTPEQIDENRKTLASFAGWLNSSASGVSK